MTAHIKVGGSFREIAGIHVHQGGAWREVAEGFVYKDGGWKAFYANEIVFINTANRTSANIFELMGSPTKKGNYVFINRATIGASGASYALRTGTFPAGSTLHIINEGNIYGLSGVAGTSGGGGAGGHALYIDFPCTIDNGAGYIFGGGGGGGRGGNGGGGRYTTTHRQPSSGWNLSGTYEWRASSANNRAEAYWNISPAAGLPTATGAFNASSVTAGGYTYLRGPHVASIGGQYHRYQIARTWSTTTNTNGGAGGAGGRGQGSNASRTNGSAGANGGTNAGRGGTGGNGGDWGVAGGTGATGANGNRTNGVAGSPGGAAGRGIVRNGHAVSVISGSGTDRLKGGIV